jgi:hypothetical protein
MAFGRMTQKFQIMRKKMTCSLATQSLYIQAITRLHNFIIDNDSLPERYGQLANLNANGEFDAEELESTWNTAIARQSWSWRVYGCCIQCKNGGWS